MNIISHRIRKFNRFEIKYLITLREAEQFKSALSAYLIPDEHGDGNGSYEISSLYYDSPNYRCYWEKVDGIKFRRKLRVRYYVSGQPIEDETPVFIEVKQRMDRVTQKRRVLLPYRDAQCLCNEREVPGGFLGESIDNASKTVIDEVHAFLWQYNLLPASIVRYRRQALIGTDYDIGLRVTFDTNLTYQVRPLHLHGLPDGLSMLPPERVIMEIKVNERIPYWLTELVAAHNLRAVRVSKYCQSIEAAHGFPSSRLVNLSMRI